MPKKIKIILKLNIPAGKANPAPPIGPALGQHGVAIMDFCKQYNEKTKAMHGVIPAVVTIFEDRSFIFELKKPPMSELIKKELNLTKGSATPNKEFVGTITDAQITKIAQDKLEDLNTISLEAAKKIVYGTCRSMGIKVA